MVLRNRMLGLARVSFRPNSQNRFSFRFQSTSVVKKTKNVNSKVLRQVNRERDQEWYSWSELFKRINWSLYFSSVEKRKYLEENCKRRQVNVDLNIVESLYKRVLADEGDKKSLFELMSLVSKLPNDTHPLSWDTPDDKPTVLRLVGSPPSETKAEFHEFCSGKQILRLDNLGGFCGHRAHLLKGPMAETSEALIRYAVEALSNNNFNLVGVPDILYPEVIESCGMATNGDHHQVYFLEDTNLHNPEQDSCLSGTAEMALGGFIHNQVFKFDQLPLKLAAVSRCYRAEASSVAEEHGFFRVHYFTKVEMFGVTAQEQGDESDRLHSEFLRIEEELFEKLGIHFQTLEMPPYELGLSAHRKFDIEAWFPGKKAFGEISSCSNCTDFQSRRLNAKYEAPDGSLKYVHTVNGTACAVPRMLMCLTETFQTADGNVNVPEVLSKYMHRSWKESMTQLPKIDSYFLRTRSQMDAVTRCYA